MAPANQSYKTNVISPAICTADRLDNVTPKSEAVGFGDVLLEFSCRILNSFMVAGTLHVTA